MRKIVLFLALCFAFPLVGAPRINAADPSLDLPVTIRDFHASNWGNPGSDGYYGHPDFESTMGTDTGIVQSALGSDKKPVYAGQTNNPTTHGQTAFDQWYRDTANINQSKAATLTFNWDGSKYVYSNSSFFPIDNQLRGNDGRSHNYHFTMEMHSRFTYQPGQTFSFTGDDDLWLFINNQRVIDLGGVHSAQSASVNLDTLGLTSGQTYDFDLFFAERHTSESNFRAETNIVLQDDDDVCLVPGQTANASTTVDFRQGLQRNGQPVAAARSNPAQGLKYEAAQSESSFFSLGFGGWLIAQFAGIIVDGTGADVKITEDTWGTYPLEKADIFVSQNGTDWKLLGTADNRNFSGIHTTAEFDLATTTLDWAKYVKVVDTTDPALFATTTSADGYDLNAIQALSSGYLGECEQQPSPNALTVTKTNRQTSFARTYKWTIDKTASTATSTIPAGRPVAVNYSIDLDRTYIDGNYSATGTIAIYNPNDSAATVTGVTDSLGSVNCGVTYPYSLAGKGTLNCSYSIAGLATKPASNTATVATSGNIAGGTDTESLNFATSTMELVDECVIVDDSYAEGPQNQEVCEPKTLAYSKSFSYSTPGTHKETNTATFVGKDNSSNTGSDSATVTLTVANQGCTYSQGYWKNHAKPGKKYDDAWDSIGRLGPQTKFFRSGQTYLQVLQTAPKGGNAYYQLARQYIATKLNIANGASSTTQVDNALAWAKNFFTGRNPYGYLTRIEQSRIRYYMGILSAYNEGRIGPGHCQENE